MIDHLGFCVRDPERSLAFYRAALAPLGIEVVQTQAENQAQLFMRKGGVTFLWLGAGGYDPRHANPGVSPVHIGFTADNAAAVDAFHAAALAAGGVDNGPPGFRRPKVYEAFVFDPDGNNIEAIWQTERLPAA
jgi:catechol 2,3-dioxygenase-like lactoylglutathione lyase family enzyme